MEKELGFVEYDYDMYSIRDDGDIISLFKDLIYTINYLREEVRNLRHDIDYVSERAVFSYNSEEE